MPLRSQFVRSFKLIVCLLLAFGTVPFAAAKIHKHNQNQVWKQQIQDLEQQWRSAILNTDVPLMDKLLSEDYVGISMSGEISTKTMQLDRLRSSKLTISKLDLTDVKVKLLGRVAIVTSLADVAGTDDGVPITGRFRYTRVYQRVSPGSWKITNFEATRLTSHRLHKNGRPDPADTPTGPTANS